MKASKMAVSALSALALMMAAGSAMAEGVVTPVTVAGGTINFTGEVTDAACVVNVKSADQNIPLGSVNTKAIVKGATVKDVPFSIVLEECSIDTYTTASFDFGGQSALDNPTVLANTAGGGEATGVGVQLKDMDSKVITIRAATGSGAKMTLAAGTNIASFSAGMYGLTTAATTGHVVATTDFKVHYE
ncbi:fimbrial protein [Rahnella sp. PCH160]|uniref:fimbrial protein n=1 Tax=Rahnella sp. PCH160 TaxID=3447928 RepID=UPI0039FC93DF